jgi:nucleoside-diphosphate-sugar epimerase
MKVLVTGGGGFLGGAIARALVARGDAVRSLARSDYPALRVLGIETVRGDVADSQAVLRAAEGCDAVIHTAAKAGVWGSFSDYYRANVEGTSNVIAACRASQITRLVHTSSPSVVFDGKDMEGVDESVPYATHFEAAYPATKAEAERLALAANGPELAVTALRPHLIWGPDDNHLVPRILARARAGRLRRIGRVDKLIDATYVDNAAAAHVLALDRLAPGKVPAGRVYFISQGEPMPLWNLVNGILCAGGLPPVQRSVPAWAARLAGAGFERVYSSFGLATEPPMTRFVARELATAHWFNLDAARRDLDYSPHIDTAEGLRRLSRSLASAGVTK